MRNLKVIFLYLSAFIFISLPVISAQTAAAPSLSSTQSTTRTEVWKAINSGHTGSASVAIMENGTLVYAEGFGMADRKASTPVDKNTLFNIGSISKVYCATAILLLVDEGKIDLDKPAIHYLPEFTMADERYKNITVRMLLNHSSGLPGTVGPNSFGYEFHKEFYNDVLNILASSHLKHQPGEMAPYCNDGFTIAEMIVAKVSGKNYIQFLEERIFAPLGLSKTNYSVGQRQNNTSKSIAKNYVASGKEERLEVLALLGSGGLSATPEDLCKFADSFSGIGPQILSPSSLKEMRKLQPSEFYNKLRMPGLSYGLGWDITEYAQYKAKGMQVLGKSGGTGSYTSMLYTIPDKRISVAVIATGSQSPSIDIANSILEAYLIDRGLYAQKNKDVKLPVTSQPIPPELAAYEGFYDSGDTLMQVKFNFPKQTVDLYRINGEQEQLQSSLLFNDNYFHAQGEKYYFTTIDDRHYFVHHFSSFDCDLVSREKLTPLAKPLELKFPIENKQWLRRNAKAYEGTLELENYIITSRLLSGIPGYVEFLGTKKVETPTAAGIAIHSMRDLTEIHWSEKDEATSVWISGMVYTPADAAPMLTNRDTTIRIGQKGYNEWLRIPKDTVLSFQSAKKGRIIVLSSDRKSIYDNYIDSDSKIIAPANSFIEFAGNPGDTFKVIVIEQASKE